MCLPAQRSPLTDAPPCEIARVTPRLARFTSVAAGGRWSFTLYDASGCL